LVGKPQEKGKRRVHPPRCENKIRVSLTNVISEDVNPRRLTRAESNYETLISGGEVSIFITTG
jgi:hypothetical protein